jgi:hypothetical protein
MSSSPEQRLDTVRNLLSRGFFLSAHDAAMAGLSDGEPHAGLRHAAVLSLARAGARTSALRLVEQWDLRVSVDPELAGLYPRLLKDLALAGRREDAVAAAQAYALLWRRHGNAWHGVNAAAMQLLAGELAACRAIARSVGGLEDLGDYWSAATLAEATLLLGDAEAAADWLGAAEARAGTDTACRATTRRQLRWEAALLGADPTLVDRLRIPETIHFCGVIPDGPVDENGLQNALRARLAGVGYAFGSLAAGGDIAVAEAALAVGAAVTVVLPYAADAFIERSVSVAGAGWVARFEHCLALADVRVLDQTPQDDLDYGLASRRAMGLARLHASRLDSKVWQLALWDGEGEAGAVAGTAFDVESWRQAGGETRVLRTGWRRRPKSSPAAAPARMRGAVLFSDMPGFGAFDDAALAAFYAGPMVALGRVVDAAAPRYRNAWGDAIQLVFDTPADAAACALALRDALAACTVERGLTIRLALDFGGLHPVFDAVQGSTKFAGRAMTRAARIEPITPPGMIYATEAFACELALSVDDGVTCDYAGMVATAKGFGVVPIYAVRACGVRRQHPFS